jgi:hypothetical protein
MALYNFIPVKPPRKHDALLVFSMQVSETRGCIQHPSQQELNAAANRLIYCKRRATVYPVISRQNNGKYWLYKALLIFINASNRKELNEVSTSYPWANGFIPATTARNQYFFDNAKQDIMIPIILKLRCQLQDYGLPNMLL